MPLTSLDELYNVLGPVVQRATGRKWWRKAAIQGQPVGPYATLHLTEFDGLEHQVVETGRLAGPGPNGESLIETPWGTGRVEAKVEFFRSGPNDSALDAAMRFRQALYLSERHDDLWKIAGFVGGVRLVDVSGMFRADVEPRAEVRFGFYANLAGVVPLAGNLLHEIDSQEFDVEVRKTDGTTEHYTTLNAARE